MSFHSELKKGLPAALQVPFAAHVVAIWLGIHPTEVSRLRKEMDITLEKSDKAISTWHLELGLELAYVQLQKEWSDPELAGQLGWTVKKLRQATMGQAPLEYLDLINLKKLGVDVNIL